MRKGLGAITKAGKQPGPDKLKGELHRSLAQCGEITRACKVRGSGVVPLTTSYN